MTSLLLRGVVVTFTFLFWRIWQASGSCDQSVSFLHGPRDCVYFLDMSYHQTGIAGADVLFDWRLVCRRDECIKCRTDRDWRGDSPTRTICVSNVDPELTCVIDACYTCTAWRVFPILLTTLQDLIYHQPSVLLCVDHAMINLEAVAASDFCACVEKMT